jgi:hypothetical protein
MAKKSSGLGRGLGDLLEDNTPSVRQGQGSTGAVRIQSASNEPLASSTLAALNNRPAPKPLYQEIHKNKSLKANFKNFK